MTDTQRASILSYEGTLETRRIRWLRHAGLASLLLAAVLAPLFVTLPFYRNMLIMLCLYAMLAQAWNLLAGYCGQISLGNAVFFGIGAYTSSTLGLWYKVTPWAGMAAGVILAVAVSQVIGYPSFRLRGHYFAIATIAIGEIVQTIMINWDAMGGARGMQLPILRETTPGETLLNFQFHTAKYPYYYIALALLLGAFGVTRLVERSRMGYYFRAIREDPDAAASLGINITRYKLMAIALSAAFTAMGGTLYAQYVLFIDPESVFPLSLSILICLVAVLGGVGTLWGPLVGSAIMIPLGEMTRVYFGGTGKALDLIIYGALIVLVAVFQPGGIMGLLRRLGGGA